MKLKSEIFHNLYSWPNVIKVRMDETVGTYIMLVEYEKIKANLAEKYLKTINY
jgi:hypothetical protein